MLMAGAGTAAGLPPGGLSLVSDYGEHGGSCGYCGSKHSSVSHGMMAESLSVEAYQELIDRCDARGWRPAAPARRCAHCTMACSPCCRWETSALWPARRPASTHTLTSPRPNPAPYICALVHCNLPVRLPQGLAPQRALGLLPPAGALVLPTTDHPAGRDALPAK